MAEAPVVALVGSDSLLGREVRDLCAGDLSFSLRLVAAGTEESGKLTRQGDQPAVVEELTEASFAGACAIILAGSPESTRKALELAGDAAVIDLTGQTEDRPDARLRAPLVEGDCADDGAGALHLIAHPAAIAAALFLRRLQAGDPIRRAVLNILAPASEHGMEGVTELQQQAVSLLSFKKLPRKIFDAQLGFSLLARYGEDAQVPLEDAEQRVERHLASLLALAGDGEGAPMPSLRLIQAPVFHGYSFSAWVQFDSNPGAAVLEETLATGAIDVRGAGFEPPNNVGQAGQQGISIGAIGPDPNDAEACWFWFVADNLRLAAENAVTVARQVV